MRYFLLAALLLTPTLQADDSESPAGATNIRFEQRQAESPWRRQLFNIRGLDYPNHVLGFNNNGIITPIDINSKFNNLDGSKITQGIVPADRLGSGTPSAELFLRGDGTWAIPPSTSSSTSWSSDVNGGGFDLVDVNTIEAETVTASLINSTDIPGSQIVGPVADLVYGKISTSKSMRYIPTVVEPTMGSTIEVNSANTYTVVTLNESTETINLTNPQDDGTSVLIRFIPHTTDTIVNIQQPVYSSFLKTNITSFKIRANNVELWQLWRSNGIWISYEPIDILDLPDYEEGSTTYFEWQKTDGGVGKITIQQLAQAMSGLVTRTGVKRTLYVTAAEMIPRVSGGPAQTTVELATNKIMYKGLLFDAIVAETAGFWVTFPTAWAGTNITVKAHWTAAGGSASETVQWKFSARGFGDNQAIDQATGVVQTVQDTLLATNNMHITATSSPITVAGTSTANKPVYFEVSRDVANDNLSVDATLIGVSIEYDESSTEPVTQ